MMEGVQLTETLQTNGNISSPNAWNTWSTPYGNIQLGPANASYGHIYTDRPSFYFNKPLLVNGTKVSLNGHTHAYAPSSHTHPASQVTAGALPVGVTATAGSDYTTGRVRNIKAGTAVPTTATIGLGEIYLRYS